jgi:hypothetical protein
MFVDGRPDRHETADVSDPGALLLVLGRCNVWRRNRKRLKEPEQCYNCAFAMRDDVNVSFWIAFEDWFENFTENPSKLPQNALAVIREVGDDLHIANKTG